MRQVIVIVSLLGLCSPHLLAQQLQPATIPQTTSMPVQGGAVYAPCVPRSAACSCSCPNQVQNWENCQPWCPVEMEKKPESLPNCKLTEINNYSTFSYLDELSASFVEFEFVTQYQGKYVEVENRTVVNVADLPSAITLGPTNPFGDPQKVGIRASGFGDILSGFFISPKHQEKRHWHLGIGPVFTLPSATDDILGSGKWTAGPGAHFSAEFGDLTAGFFLWQSWSFAGDPSAKDVNLLFGKPFLIYELTFRTCV